MAYYPTHATKYQSHFDVENAAIAYDREKWSGNGDQGEGGDSGIQGGTRCTTGVVGSGARTTTGGGGGKGVATARTWPLEAQMSAAAKSDRPWTSWDPNEKAAKTKGAGVKKEQGRETLVYTESTELASARREPNHAEYLSHLDRLARGDDSEAPSAGGVYQRTLRDGSVVSVRMGAPLENSTLWCPERMTWGDQGVSEAGGLKC